MVKFTDKSYGISSNKSRQTLYGNSIKIGSNIRKHLISRALSADCGVCSGLSGLRSPAIESKLFWKLDEVETQVFSQTSSVEVEAKRGGIWRDGRGRVSGVAGGLMSSHNPSLDLELERFIELHSILSTWVQTPVTEVLSRLCAHWNQSSDFLAKTSTLVKIYYCSVNARYLLIISTHLMFS